VHSTFARLSRQAASRGSGILHRVRETVPGMPSDRPECPSVHPGSGEDLVIAPGVDRLNRQRRARLRLLEYITPARRRIPPDCHSVLEELPSSAFASSHGPSFGVERGSRTRMAGRRRRIRLLRRHPKDPYVRGHGPGTAVHSDGYRAIQWWPYITGGSPYATAQASLLWVTASR
jgi:hypothetical protein